MSHPFPTPTEEEVERNEHLCANPPQYMHPDPPLHAITPAELNRLKPVPIYTTHQWLNDAIVSSVLKLMHLCSPYNTRHHLP